MSIDVRNCRGWSLMELLVVIAVIAALVATLSIAIVRVRETSRGIQCQSQLRQLGVAVAAHVAAHGHYPPAASLRVGAHPRGLMLPPRLGLFVFLLPFLDESTRYRQFDMAVDWNHPRNYRFSHQDLGGVLLCPSAPGGRRSKHASDYTAAVAVDPSDGGGLGRLLRDGLLTPRSRTGPPSWGRGERMWQGALRLSWIDYRSGRRDRRRSRPKHVLDGLSKTVLLVENAGKPICYQLGRRADCQITRFRWASPTSWMVINDVCHQQQLVNCSNNSQPYGFHREGLYLLYGDGAVHFCPEDVSANVFVSSITAAGHDGLSHPRSARP